MSLQLRITRAALFLALAAVFGCSKSPDAGLSVSTAQRPDLPVHREIRVAMPKIAPFFTSMPKPKAYDWLASNNEPGQTFDEYLDSEPTKPTKDRQKIYVLPLGTFNAEQKRAIDTAAGYLEAFYDLPAEKLPARMVAAPYPNFRYNEYAHRRQVKTGFFLNDVLPRMLPPDAAALIAFTNEDLFPDESMNYVFGQASMNARVGIWSLARLYEKARYPVFLRRVIKIATHETGHMFSMKHCIKYECVMSGTNQLAETDSRPIDACPECMAKVCWLSDVLPKERYERIAAFCRKNGLAPEAAEFEKKARALS